MNKFHMISCRLHLYDKSRLLIQGWFDEDKAGRTRLHICLDKKELPTKEEIFTEVGAILHPEFGANATAHCYNYWVRLPEQRSFPSKLIVFCSESGNIQKITEISASRLEKLGSRVDCCFEGGTLTEDGFTLRGWFACGRKVSFHVIDKSTGEYLPASVEYFGRPDLIRRYPEAHDEEVRGYTVRGEGLFPKKILLQVTDGKRSSSFNVVLDKSKLRKKAEKVSEFMMKARVYQQQFGVRHTLERCVDKLYHREGINYNAWRSKTLLAKEELEKQRSRSFVYKPVFTLIAVVSEKSAPWARKLCASLEAQTYSAWKLIILNTEMFDETGDMKRIQALAATDQRITVVVPANDVLNSTAAGIEVSRSDGDYTALIRPDAVLSPETFYSLADLLDHAPDTQILYTDEDEIDASGRSYTAPKFKPDYDPDLLRSMNYIGSLFVVKSEIASKCAAESAKAAGLWEYDYILRCCEEAHFIRHIPAALYHRRLTRRPADMEKAESRKRRCSFRDITALNAHCDRSHINAKAETTDTEGVYHLKYQRTGDPLVSVIIPNMDHAEDLERCIDSIEEHESYKNIEYVIVENNSTDPAVFAYYQRLQSENHKARVVIWKKEFNYSAINNFGVEQANGEYLLLMNNDLKVIADDSIEEMLGICMRPDVGAVGAKLYYSDGTIQHAGVIMGLGGVAGHAFSKEPGNTIGYCGRAVAVQDLSAVTAACVMVKRKAFEEVSGFSTELSVAYNDIDFCLKMRSKGWLIVFTPFAQMYHYESKSRGNDSTPEAAKRFFSEVETFTRRWQPVLDFGDPYYNPNLSLQHSDFRLKTETTGVDL